MAVPIPRPSDGGSPAWGAPRPTGGRVVLQRALSDTRSFRCEVGLTRLRLETNRALTEAQALYKGEGYQEVTPFNAEPYAHHWFEKRL